MIFHSIKMNFSSVQLLIAINFLNSFASGLTAYLLSPHIVMHGGNDIITGIMVAGTIACQKISKNFHAFFQHGAKFSIAISLIATLITYMILIFTSSYWIVLLCRFTYALFNRIEKSCKEFITANHDGETDLDLEKSLNLIEINSIAGTCFGAIIGGYLFYLRPQFSYVAMLATLLTFANMFILEHIEDNPKMDAPEDIAVLSAKCVNDIENLKQLSWKENWNAMLLKSAYVTSFTIFFTKYALLLKYNYQVGTLIIGYTVAYQTMLVFASRSIIPTFKDRLSIYARDYFEPILLACSITLVGIFYAPSYECYLLVFIPLIFTHAFLDNFMDDALHLKSHENAYKANMTISCIIEIVIPFIFGFICVFSGKNAFKIFCILPSAVCIYILNKRFTNVQGPAQEENRAQAQVVEDTLQGPSQGPKVVENENKED